MTVAFDEVWLTLCATAVGASQAFTSCAREVVQSKSMDLRWGAFSGLGGCSLAL